MSTKRLIAVATVVIIAGALLAALLDRGKNGKTVAKTVTVGATDTVTVTHTVAQAPETSGSSSSVGPEAPPPTEEGFEVRWKGRLRLNQTGHDLSGVNGPSPQRYSPNVYVTDDGNLDFDEVTVAEWTARSKPSASDCTAQANTQSLSAGEAESIRPKAGLTLCLTLTAEDESSRVGYMRVGSDFTVRAVNVDGVLWDVR